MNHRIDLLLVNAPADLGKKPFDLAFPFQRRLNFGLLSLATVARRDGLSVMLFDPQVAPQRDAEAWLADIVSDVAPGVVGISCISGFSYPTTRSFARTVKKIRPDCPVIVGGKDHVGQLGGVPLSDCESIDVVVRGEAETILSQLVRALMTGSSLDSIPNLFVRDSQGRPNPTRSDAAAAQGERVRLDYDLLPDSAEFAPSIEVSRGCSFGCEFCVSARTVVRRAPPQIILEEIEGLVRHYGDDTLRLYFESPMFLMRDAEIQELADERRRRGMQFTWRTETRVDYLDTRRLSALYDAGLRVLDLGFESGCREVLLRMKKTNDPEGYLKRSREILRTAFELGIIVKLNVLFYIGETLGTVARTLEFLDDCTPWVQCVSAYPLMLYPGSQLEHGLTDELETFGGSLVTSGDWQGRHLWPINLSGQLTYAQASDLGLKFAKSFQTLDSFYEQKRYGYFSPSVTRSQFNIAAVDFGIERLPFSENGNAAVAARTAFRASLPPPN